MSVDLDSDVPINQQLYEQIVDAVATGVLGVGSRLPSTRQLAEQFGINFHTVNKAYSRLHQQGFIRLSRRTGAVVLRDGSALPDDGFVEEWRHRLRPILAEAAAHGLPTDEVFGECQKILRAFRMSRPA